MKNIILINLENYTNKDLKDLASIGLSSESFISDKEKGFKKLWINTDSEDIVAFTKRNDKIQTTKSFANSLSLINEFKIGEIKTEIILDLDVILDKISNYGIKSLVKEEKDFLDSLK